MLCFLALSLAGAALAGEPDRPAFWDRQRKGGNNRQNRRVGPEYWKAAADAGLEFVRLLPDAWPTSNRDFLMGNADGFTALDEADLAVLVRSLDEAHAAGRQGGPGADLAARARGGSSSMATRTARACGRDAAFQAQAEAFWRQLAGRLRGHPAIAGLQPPQRAAPRACLRLRGAGRGGLRRVARPSEGNPRRPRRLQPAAWWPPSGAPTPTRRSSSTGGSTRPPSGSSLLEPIEARGHPLRLPLLRSVGVLDLPREPGPLVLPGTHARPRREGGSRRRRHDARARGAGRALGTRTAESRRAGSWPPSSAWIAVSAARSRTSTTWCAC